jgi:hypothetical protein
MVPIALVSLTPYPRISGPTLNADLVVLGIEATKILATSTMASHHHAILPAASNLKVI